MWQIVQTRRPTGNTPKASAQPLELCRQLRRPNRAILLVDQVRHHSFLPATRPAFAAVRHLSSVGAVWMFFLSAMGNASVRVLLNIVQMIRVDRSHQKPHRRLVRDHHGHEFLWIARRKYFVACFCALPCPLHRRDEAPSQSYPTTSDVSGSVYIAHSLHTTHMDCYCSVYK